MVREQQERSSCTARQALIPETLNSTPQTLDPEASEGEGGTRRGAGGGGADPG